MAIMYAVLLAVAGHLFHPPILNSGDDLMSDSG
jgi:hypothetical protein